MVKVLHCYSALTIVNGFDVDKALACSSRVSLGSLMSLSQPGSHEEISLITDLDLSDISGVTRGTQSAYHVRDQWIGKLSSSHGNCSDVPGLL